LGANVFVGDFCEIIVFGRALTSAERNALNDYLNAKYADSTPPSVPQPVSSVLVGTTSATLIWPAATDNIKVVGYDIYRDGQWASSTVTTSCIVSGLAPSTVYEFTVRARDAAGNRSAESPPLSVTTLPSTGSAPVDTDHDGLPDVWEIAHGFDPLATNNANGDPDGDGLSNLQEYLAGSDPNRATTPDTANQQALRVIWP
jgi:hypothetical protein